MFIVYLLLQLGAIMVEVVGLEYNGNDTKVFHRMFSIDR